MNVTTGLPLVEGTRHILEAMRHHGVTRHIGHATPKQGDVRAGFFGTDRLGFSVSRADIAAFTAVQVDDDTYVRRAPAISS